VTAASCFDAHRFLQLVAEFRLSLLDPPSYDDLLTLAERYNLAVYDAAVQ
jgi:hypothetical protein